MTTANKRIAIVPKGLIYKKVTQTRVSSGRWLPKFGGMASASREKAFRHVWSKRGDRRLGFFQFRITRDDGTIIDHTLLERYGLYISQKTDAGRETIGHAHGYLPDQYPGDVVYWTKEGDIWYYYNNVDWDFPSEFSYNTQTKIWNVPFYVRPDRTPKRGKQFWVTFRCEDSAYCIYVPSTKKYIYKENDFYDPNECIKPKLYEVRVPYYKEISTVRNPAPEDLPVEDYCFMYAPRPHYCYPTAGGYYRITIQSSLPYKVAYDAHDYSTGAFWGKYMNNCSGTCAQCVIDGDASEARWLISDPPDSIHSIKRVVSCSTTHGDSSSDIENDPLVIQHIVTPTPYTVEEGEFQITVIPNSLIYELKIACPGGEVSFFLDLKVVRSNYEISAYPYLD